MLRSKAGKEHKEIKSHKSFLDWFTTLSELGLLTPDLRGRDPITYDAMDWHFKSMDSLQVQHEDDGQVGQYRCKRVCFFLSRGERRLGAGSAQGYVDGYLDGQEIRKCQVWELK